MMKNARSAGFLPQMTAAEFAAALKANGFRVVKAKTRRQPGSAPAFGGRPFSGEDGRPQLHVREGPREAEIARKAKSN